MLNVSDSRFQEELLAEAKKYKKIPEGYRIPDQFRNNTPERLAATLKDFKAQGLFADFPFGSAFTDVEMLLAYSLKIMKAKATGPGAAEIPAIMQTLPAEAPPKRSRRSKRISATQTAARPTSASAAIHAAAFMTPA